MLDEMLSSSWFLAVGSTFRLALPVIDVVRLLIKPSPVPYFVKPFV